MFVATVTVVTMGLSLWLYFIAPLLVCPFETYLDFCYCPPCTPLKKKVKLAHLI